MAAICLVVPCGYRSELFDLCEVILHQMAQLVELRIIIALDFTVGYGGSQQLRRAHQGRLTASPLQTPYPRAVHQMKRL